LIARKVCRELEQTTMSTFYKICPSEIYSQGGKRADSEYYLKMNNGSEILWMHMDSSETENVIRGLEVNWFFIDQAEELDEEIFDHLLTRLGRWDKAQVPEHILQMYGGVEGWKWKNPVTGVAVPPNYAMLACNPESNLLHWIYRRFHPDSPEHAKKTIPIVGRDGKTTGVYTSYKEMGYKLVEISARENKYLPTATLQEMLSKDKSYIDRFVDGKWGGGEGQIHAIPAESIIPGDTELLEYLKRTCLLHMSLDHGDAAPTCCAWWATDGQGNVFCLGEY
jgi:hypothetical protein